MSFITEHFHLSSDLVAKFLSKVQPRLDNGTLFGMGAISEVVYYRTYSRIMADGKQEGWCDTILRVANGVGSILKTHFISHRLEWNNDMWQTKIYKLAKYMGLLRILPPGRGLWAMGTPLIEKRGAMFLYNCGAVTSKDLLVAADWAMDALMSGVGIGSDTAWDGDAYPIDMTVPAEQWVVEDSREGWVASVRRLLNCWIPDKQHGQTPSQRPCWVKFDYSQVRCEGTPLKTFGGIASGPRPLIELHDRIFKIMNAYIDGSKSKTRTSTDVINSIGACVVAGNLRRSAQLILGSADDYDFINLKNMEVHPDRSDIAWMSNNSVLLTQSDQFTKYVGVISKLIQNNGEPGIINQINVQHMGRIGEPKEDHATLMNPCVTGDTMIMTRDGRVRVDGLIGKKFVAVCNGLYYQSDSRGFWKTGDDNIIFELTASNGKKLRCTEDHMLGLRLEGKNGHIWRPLNRLQVGDEIRIHCNEGGDAMAFVTITSIEEVGFGDVYDCYIPFANYYDSNGFMSHNCSEIPLESHEVCNLAEVFPNRCTPDQLLKAMDLATFYTTVVTLLPTHRPETNVIVARNRRIGVSMSGLATWKDTIGATNVTRSCRDAYRHVVEMNSKYARMFGIPSSVRVSTVKPSGSVSLLAGETPGMHYPPFTRFVRRIIISAYDTVATLLNEAGYPHELRITDPGDIESGRPRKYDESSLVFEFPGKYNCDRTAEDVSMWEQFAFLAQLQREWADNSVSVTVTFNKDTEGNQIEHALGMYLPLVKSVSMLPHTPKGAYLQMPYEGITEDEYQRRVTQVRPVNWSQLKKSDGIQEKFCTNDSCAL